VESSLSLPPAQVNREMSTSDIIDRVIPQCLANNVQVIALSGGEVLMRRDADIIFRELGKSDIRWCLDSNLMLCTQHIAEEIIDSSCDAVFVSLDGPCEVHNKLRCNPKAYDKCIKGLERLLLARNEVKNSHTSVIMNCVLQPGNESVLPDVVQIAAEYGVDEVTFQLLSARKYEYPFSADIAMRSIQKAFNMANDCGLRASLYPLSPPSEEDLTSWFSMPLNRDFYNSCTYVHNNLRIDPAGNVIPCIEYQMGNILEDDLLNIWNGSAYKTFREHLEFNGPFEVCLRCCNMNINSTRLYNQGL
jgi:MoaA/NifB/PqqE/SkfB family radical SAM enzyme